MASVDEIVEAIVKADDAIETAHESLKYLEDMRDRLVQKYAYTQRKYEDGKTFEFSSENWKITGLGTCTLYKGVLEIVYACESNSGAKHEFIQRYLDYLFELNNPSSH